MHSPTGNNLARTLLAKAIELDPNSAEAHACLAISHYGAAINYGEDVKANQALPPAYAQKAVSLDMSDPLAHRALGYVRLQEGKLEEAESAFQTALRINPNHADTMANMAGLRVLQGQPDDAIELAENALRLNPIRSVGTTGTSASRTMPPAIIPRRSGFTARRRLAGYRQSASLPRAWRSSVSSPSSRGSLSVP